MNLESIGDSFINHYRKATFLNYPVQIIGSWISNGTLYYRILFRGRTAVVKPGNGSFKL